MEGLDGHVFVSSLGFFCIKNLILKIFNLLTLPVCFSTLLVNTHIREHADKTTHAYTLSLSHTHTHTQL